MPEQLEKFFNDVKEIIGYLLSPLSPQIRRLLFIGLPLFGSLAYVGFYGFERMNYGALYTNLSPQDGAAIIKELEAEKIPYSISGGGAVIEVPRGAVYQTRLRLAGKGVPAGGGVGFEIFEKTPFGASEFTQQVNYLRALQGELSRTINSLAAVQSSRIHVALPSRSNFLGPEEKPSASVVVDLRPGNHLSPDQVQGIVNLVASSVPKLSPDKVTVIDSSGRPLKEIVLASAGSEAEKLNLLKLKHEQELERRIETMLDPVLGPGKVVVRANVEINPQETQMTKEEFDPDNKVVRSQRQSIDDAGTKSGGSAGVQANIPGGDATKVSSDKQFQEEQRNRHLRNRPDHQPDFRAARPDPKTLRRRANRRQVRQEQIYSTHATPSWRRSKGSSNAQSASMKNGAINSTWPTCPSKFSLPRLCRWAPPTLKTCLRHRRA